MKIDTLIIRENFKKIVEKTLSEFFKDLNGKSYVINWKPISSKQSNFESSQNWYCNPLINSIFVKDVDKKVFNSINGEYYFNPVKPWKSYIQRIYLILSQSTLLRTYFSKYILEISPKIENAESKLIIGGNKKFRFIDIKKREVYVILKKGFNKKYLERDKYIRNNFNYLPLPKIIKSGKKNFWYSEEYIVGVPPNRLKSKSSFVILKKAILDIRKLNFYSKKEVDINKYVNNLQKNIHFELEKIPRIDDQLKNKIIEITSILVDTFSENFNSRIFISQCHGDFHQGNILTNGKKYWILDWENSGIKQIGYDLFVYLMDSRIDKGFSKKFMKLFNGNLSETKKHMINYWPELIKSSLLFKKEYLLIFLLEDLIFYLDEINNKLFYNNPLSLKNRIIEFELILNKLKLV